MLAREAEIPYCTIAMVTDYDCWHPHFYTVNVEKIVQQNQTFVKANYLTKKESLELIENLYMCKKAVHYG